MAGATRGVEDAHLAETLTVFERGAEDVGLDARQDGRSLPFENARDGVGGLAAARRTDDAHRGTVTDSPLPVGEPAPVGRVAPILGGDEPTVDASEDHPSGRRYRDACAARYRDGVRRTREHRTPTRTSSRRRRRSCWPSTTARSGARARAEAATHVEDRRGVGGGARWRSARRRSRPVVRRREAGRQAARRATP